MANLVSKARRVKLHLKKGRKLTKRQCRAKYNYDNVGDIIHIIRKACGPKSIITIKKKNKTDGEFAVYVPNVELLQNL